ncbi:MAG: adenylate kinase [Bacteroidales bacterium]|nr:adenylate kinase [Bacteroidales bacterium]
MKYYILFGPPGAGKGTHASAIAEKYNLKHISTGELLRAEIAAGSELGKEAKKLIDAGSLVPDAVVEGMIESAFDTIKGVDGFLLDGFPRNLAQAADLNAILAKRGEEITGVIGIMISDEVVRKRIAHRAAIEGRADDASDETITNRINTYHAQTEPLIAFYKEAGKYYECNGDQGDIADNRARVLALVETIK